MARRLGAVLAAVAVVAATLVAPATAKAAAPARSPFASGVVAAARYTAAHDLRSGVAVMDTRTGQVWSAGAAYRSFASASVVKTLIAARLLLEHRMIGANRRLAWKMITQSDNAAAYALWPKVGRGHVLRALQAHYHLPKSGRPPTMPGIWGSTQLTAHGLVRLYAAMRHDHTVWPWLSDAMRHYRKISSSGEPNAFGVAAVFPHAAVKNGWDVNRDVRHPRNAIINSTGLVANGRYAVAILAEGPGRLYYSAGERIVTAAVRRALHSLLPRTATRHARAAARWVATVVLDPGHNGGNASHLAAINRRVYAGYGRYKPCNTTGTATNSGYPEYAFTWDVAKRVKKILNAHHVRVISTRRSDHGVGPCVNRRAKIESTRGVAAAIAIHADGSAPGNHGFHLCIDSRRPVGATKATVARTRELNFRLRLALRRHSGMTLSNYLGRRGYYYRDDLAGLNLSTNPTAFLELGNMRDRHDAALQRTAAGRQRIAEAVALGILAYLARR